MKLLILSFYYPPDLGAGSFRMTALIKALEPYSKQGLSVEVITTQPNRYADIARKVESLEDHGWLKIRRISIPSHQSGMSDQARAFISYARGVRKLTELNTWDMVFATSSRLMTAALGAHVARRIKAPLYLDIRDLFTDTMKDVLKDSLLRYLMPVFRRLEQNTFRYATHINVVSEAFIEHIDGARPGQTFSIFTNGIDPEFLCGDFTKSKIEKGANNEADLPVILYAGNIGEGQGLHKVLPDAVKMLDGQATFRVLGDGGRTSQLKDAIDKIGKGKIEILPPVSRQMLMKEYSNADILFLHLNDYPAFLKVLPSKIFEYAATGKPILAGVAGHAADFLRSELPDAAIFEPCDADAMTSAARLLIKSFETPDRNIFRNKFSRTTIMANMAEHLIKSVKVK